MFSFEENVSNFSMVSLCCLPYLKLHLKTSDVKLPSTEVNLRVTKSSYQVEFKHIQRMRIGIDLQETCIIYTMGLCHFR